MMKTEVAGEVGVMEWQPSLGVCTRAKTQALRRLQEAAAAAVAAAENGGDYLQLRSRTLKRQSNSPNSAKGKRQRTSNSTSMGNEEKEVEEGGVNGGGGSDADDGVAANGGGEGAAAIGGGGGGEGVVEDGGVEGDSFVGENLLELDGIYTEAPSTPRHLMIDPNIIRMPVVRPKAPRQNANGRTRIPPERCMQMPPQFDHYMTVSEEEQRKLFIEKYNYDPLTDKPLPGRFQWTKVDP